MIKLIASDLDGTFAETESWSAICKQRSNRGTRTYSQDAIGCLTICIGAVSPRLRIESHTHFNSDFIVGKKRNMTNKPSITDVGV